MEKVSKTFLGTFFWVPTPLRRYQNTSGCNNEYEFDQRNETLETLKIFVNFESL